MVQQMPRGFTNHRRNEDFAKIVSKIANLLSSTAEHTCHMMRAVIYKRSRRKKTPPLHHVCVPGTLLTQAMNGNPSYGPNLPQRPR